MVLLYLFQFAKHGGPLDTHVSALQRVDARYPGVHQRKELVTTILPLHYGAQP